MSDFAESASHYKMTLVCAKMLLCGRLLQYIFARSALRNSCPPNLQSHMVVVQSAVCIYLLERPRRRKLVLAALAPTDHSLSIAGGNQVGR